MLGRIIVASCLVLASPGAGSAQALFPLSLPLASPAATVSQRIGLTDLSVTYHRPAVAGRQVWGHLVPYDQVWRAGANENTVLMLATDATVGGMRVPPDRTGST